jgi:hypothetical protein
MGSTIRVTFKNGSRTLFYKVKEVYDGSRVFEITFTDGRKFKCHASTVIDYEEL